MRHYLQKNCKAAGDDEQMINYEWPKYLALISYGMPLFNYNLPQTRMPKSIFCVFYNINYFLTGKQL